MSSSATLFQNQLLMLETGIKTLKQSKVIMRNWFIIIYLTYLSYYTRFSGSTIIAPICGQSLQRLNYLIIAPCHDKWLRRPASKDI